MPHLHVSALCLRLHAGELRQDDHDVDPLGLGGDGHAAVRVQVAGAAAPVHRRKVRNYLQSTAV